MKKLVIFAVIVGLACGFGFFGCNNPGAPGTGSGSGEGGEGEGDILFVWGTLQETGENAGTVTGGETILELTNGTNYPGAALTLADCNNIYAVDRSNTDNPYSKPAPELGDISNYGQIILTAVFYSDDDATTEVTGDVTGQFCIMSGTSGDWNNDRKLTDDGYNIKNNIGKNTTPKSGASGKPEQLLVQASYLKDGSADTPQYAEGMAVRVKVLSLEFKLRTDLPTFTVQYGPNGVSTDGNKITFTNSAYNSNDGAALFKFPESWNPDNGEWHDVLKGKTLVFDFRIEDADTPQLSSADEGSIEHQIHVQANDATKSDDNYNGGNPPGDKPEAGQKYITLDDNGGGKYNQSYNTTTKSGTFKIALNDLITAATEETSDQYNFAPFTLNSIRITNNGTTWDKNAQGNTTGVTHIRHKSYSVIFDSIRVEN